MRLKQINESTINSAKTLIWSIISDIETILNNRSEIVDWWLGENQLELNMKSDGFEIIKVYSIYDDFIRKYFEEQLTILSGTIEYRAIENTQLLETHEPLGLGYSILCSMFINFLKPKICFRKSEFNDLKEGKIRISFEEETFNEFFDEVIWLFQNNLWKFKLIYPIINFSFQFDDKIEISNKTYLVNGSNENKNQLSKELDFFYQTDADFRYISWLIDCDCWIETEIMTAPPKDLYIPRFLYQKFTGFIPSQYYQEVFYLLGYTRIKINLFSQLSETVILSNSSVKQSWIGVNGYNQITPYDDSFGYIPMSFRDNKNKQNIDDTNLISFLRYYPIFRYDLDWNPTKFALNRFYKIFYYRDFEDVILDCVIALEGLISKSSTDISLAFRLKVSAIISDKPNVRRKIYHMLKEVYNFRSLIVHGGGIKPNEISKKLKILNNLPNASEFCFNILRTILLKLIYFDNDILINQSSKLDNLSDKILLNDKFEIKTSKEYERALSALMQLLNDKYP